MCATNIILLNNFLMLKFGEETLLVFFIERRFKYFMSSESTFASVSRFAPIVLVCVCLSVGSILFSGKEQIKRQNYKN